jgi:hypothetical protein
VKLKKKKKKYKKNLPNTRDTTIDFELVFGLGGDNDHGSAILRANDFRVSVDVVGENVILSVDDVGRGDSEEVAGGVGVVGFFFGVAISG